MTISVSQFPGLHMKPTIFVKINDALKKLLVMAFVPGLSTDRRLGQGVRQRPAGGRGTLGSLVDRAAGRMVPICSVAKG